MAFLQNLSIEQINEAVAAAVERSVPATITIRSSAGWIKLRSRAMAAKDGYLWVKAPTTDPDGQAYPLAPADKVGLSFKLKHYKHMCLLTVAGSSKLADEQGNSPSVLRLCLPSKMQRLQRRAYVRAEVPENRVVRASFWLGGIQSEPAGTRPDRPVWSGRVVDISAGGFRFCTEGRACEYLEIDDIVGVRLVFGAGRETIFVDAQFRHAEATSAGPDQPENLKALLGFQFIGLSHSAEGREALKTISARVGEFHNQKRLSSLRAS